VARSIWNGTISFGLLTVPIKVHSAIEDRGVHFHQVHAKDGARIRQRRICSREGTEVPYDQVAKGYELREGEYVVLDQREIDAAAGEPSRRIELEEFVCEKDIDPVFYDRTYHLGAGADGRDGYRLLHDALAQTGRAGVGRWVFHNREYLVAVRSRDGALALQTMRFADQLVATGRLSIPDPSRPPTRREVEMAGALVEALQAPFDPSAFRDTHRELLLELIRRKAAGESIELPESEEPAATPDLIAALEASLSATKGKHTRGAARGRTTRAGSSGTQKSRAKG
jgi:DNA end-binding protein Ku